MRRILFCVCALAINTAIAADLVPISKRLECGSSDVLTLLAKVIQSSNGLSPQLSFNFEDVRARALTTNEIDRIYLVCEANMELIDQPSKKVVDSMRIDYRFEDTGKNDEISIFFAPKY